MWGERKGNLEKNDEVHRVIKVRMRRDISLKNQIAKMFILLLQVFLYYLTTPTYTLSYGQPHYPTILETWKLLFTH